MFQSISMYFLLRTLKSRSVVNPVLCGATGALVAWCRLPVGGVHGVAVVAALAIMVYASPERKRYLGALAAFLAGTVLVHAAFFASLWWAGAIDHWYYQNIAWPAYWVSLAKGNDTRRDKVLHVIRKLFLLDPMLISVGQWYAPGVPLTKQGLATLLLSMLVVLGLIGLLAIPQLRSPASSDGLDRRRSPFLATFLPLVLFTAIEWLFLHDAYDVLETPYGFAIPVVILAATLVTLLRHFSHPGQFKDPASPDALVLACGLISLVSWLQFYPASDVRHQFWSIAPGIGLFVFYLFRSVGGRVPAVAAGILLFALPLCAGRVIQVAEAGPHARIPGDSILAGVYVPADDLPRWNALLDAVDRQVAARPDIPMLLRGPDGLFGTLVKNLRNPSPFFISWTKDHTSESAPAVDWSRFGVPNLEAKHQAFFDKYHPIIYVREGDSELLNYYGKLNYKIIAKEKGLSRSGVVLMARDSLGSDADPRVVEK